MLKMEFVSNGTAPGDTETMEALAMVEAKLLELARKERERGTNGKRPSADQLEANACFENGSGRNIGGVGNSEEILEQWSAAETYGTNGRFDLRHLATVQAGQQMLDLRKRHNVSRDRQGTADSLASTLNRGWRSVALEGNNNETVPVLTRSEIKELGLNRARHSVLNGKERISTVNKERPENDDFVRFSRKEALPIFGKPRSRKGGKKILVRDTGEVTCKKTFKRERKLKLDMKMVVP